MNFETIQEKLAYSLGSMAMGQKIMDIIQELYDEHERSGAAGAVLESLMARIREI